MPSFNSDDRRVFPEFFSNLHDHPVNNDGDKQVGKDKPVNNVVLSGKFLPYKAY